MRSKLPKLPSSLHSYLLSFSHVIDAINCIAEAIHEWSLQHGLTFALVYLRGILLTVFANTCIFCTPSSNVLKSVLFGPSALPSFRFSAVYHKEGGMRYTWWLNSASTYSSLEKPEPNSHNSFLCTINSRVYIFPQFYWAAVQYFFGPAICSIRHNGLNSNLGDLCNKQTLYG